MGNSYVRQSAADIQTGNIVEADPINAEFNALQSAFDASAGHSHDGTVGEGQKISLTSSIVGVLPVANGGYGGIHNNSASTDPGVTNDSSQGYSVGSVWINTTAKSYFVCTDNTLGAAVWNSFQLVDSALGSIAGLTTTANQTIYTTGSDTYATTSLTAYGRSLIDDADAATARGTLGLGTIATQNSNSVTITGGAITGTPISGSTVAGTTGTFSGNVSGVAGTFSGAVSGTTGTFSGAVSGTTGTFSGAVSGTTGTFSGTITTGGNAVWHAGNLTPANYAPLAGATFTGGISGTTASFSGSVTASGQAVWHAGNLTPSDYTPLAGGTMTGLLTLSGDPIVALGATPKQYVDNKGTLYGFRNKIIDPNFDFWTATSSTAAGYGPATMWADNHVGATKTASQQAHTLGQTSVPGNPTWFHRTVVSGAGSAAGDFCTTYQNIESVKTLSGKTATVTFWAKADANKNIAVDVSQYFGTGGSPSATVSAIGARQISLTTAWQKFSFTVAIPSITGKTIGTNNNDFLSLTFWYTAGTSWAARAASLPLQTGTFDISSISLVEGDATGEADPTSVRHPAIEQYLVTDMFEIVDGVVLQTGAFYCYYFKTKKRRPPSIVFSPDGGTGATFVVRNNSTMMYQNSNHSIVSGFSATVDQRL